MKKHLQLSLLSISMLLVSSTCLAYGDNVGDGNYGGSYSNYKSAPRYKGDSFQQQTYKGDRMQETAAPCQGKCLLGGFYLGAAGGYDSYKVNTNVSETDFDGNSASSNPKLNVTGFAGQGFVGYGHYFSQLYLGGEIFGGESNSNTSYITQFVSDGLPDTYYTRVSVRQSYGIALLPGAKMSDSTLLYGRVGYNRANIRTQENLSAALLGGTAATSTGTSNWRYGLNYGLGIEGAIFSNVSLRGEYTHTQFTSGVTSSFGTKFTPSNNEFMLGLIVHIC